MGEVGGLRVIILCLHTNTYLALRMPPRFRPRPSLHKAPSLLPRSTNWPQPGGQKLPILRRLQGPPLSIVWLLRGSEKGAGFSGDFVFALFSCLLVQSKALVLVICCIWELKLLICTLFAAF